MKAFWNGFEKKAILGALIRPALSAAASLGKKAVTKPLAVGGTILTGLEGASAASAASGSVANSRRMNQTQSLMRSAGGTF